MYPLSSRPLMLAFLAAVIRLDAQQILAKWNRVGQGFHDWYFNLFPSHFYL